MDPLTPTTSTLEPAIAHIAETVRGLAGSLQETTVDVDGREKGQGEEARKVKKAQQDTVRWVLATPDRLQGLLDEGESEEANKDWAEVHGLLKKWEGVKGVEKLESQCLKVMGKRRSDSVS